MFAYGGRIFNQTPSLCSRIPGHFLGESLETAVAHIDFLLTKRPFAPQVDPVSEKHSQALHQYRQQQAAIEAKLWQALQHANIPYEELTNANLHLAKDISAALTLGNVSLLSEEISWTEKLLLNYNMPADHLSYYLAAYNKAAHEVLDSGGEPILNWLDGIANEKAEG